MKTKTSQSLPHDEKSMLQAIRGIHYQVYSWSRVNVAIISDISLKIMVKFLKVRIMKYTSYASLVHF